MINYDQYGIPFESGASDRADVCRLNSLMYLFDHPKAVEPSTFIKKHKSLMFLSVDLFFWKDEPFVRHPFTCMKPMEPENDPKNFSRDQGIPLRVALLKQDIFTDKRWREQNGDLMITPAQRGCLTICSGELPKWYHYKGLELELKYNAWRLQRWVDKKEPYPVEQNQIISMCYAYRWLKQYKESTPHWEAAIKHYWDEWRCVGGEMSKLMIDGINKY